MYYLYNSINDAKVYINDNLRHMQLHQAKEYGETINEKIALHIDKNLHQELKNNANLRETIESLMSAQITSYYKYIYILYKDKNGDFRYLLDGSKNDKGVFGRKLSVDLNSWNNVYKNKKDLVIHQDKLDKLWMTYLKPIIIKKKVQAVLAIDFSTDFSKSTSNLTKPLSRALLYLYIASGILITILIVQAILGHKNKRESITDPLTQAYNRNYLRDFIKNNNLNNYQIMMIDIDYFKKINDTYGHKAGDLVLSEMAHIIKHEIRYHDEFIRFGGEEFLLFVHNKNEQLSIAYEIAQRLRTTIENKIFVYENINIKLTISIGINCSPKTFKNIHEAIKYADKMLYQAKKSGRNKVVFE